jgi:hypothetical protein
MTGQLQFPEPTQGTINPATGQAAKERGMSLAAANTTPSWADACDAAIALMAARGEVFQAADLIAEGLVDEPALPAQWGPRFAKAARDGVIEHVSFAPSKRATVHRSICKTWRGVGGTREGRAAA